MLNFSQKQKIKKSFSSPYIYLFILWFFIFFFINFYFNEIYVIWFSVFHYWIKIYLPYVFFTLFNTFLIALSINLIILKVKEVRSISSKWWFFWTVWTFFALLTWACPWCVAWIFPAFMWMFGSHYTMMELPLMWLELQIISFVFLLFWIYFLSKDMSCKLKK